MLGEELEHSVSTIHSQGEKYKILVNNVPDISWSTPKEGLTTFISKNVYDVFGYTPEEILNAPAGLWLEQSHPDDVENVKNAFKSLFNDNKPFDIEHRIKRKDGQWLYLHDRSFSTYINDGVQFADGIFSDITKKTEQEETEKLHTAKLVSLG